MVVRAHARRATIYQLSFPRGPTLGRVLTPGSSMQPDPDRSLVEASAAGDADAFGTLVGRYQARLVNLARAMTADDGEAEDLAQEAFIRAYKAIGRFRGDSAFGTWLYRIAVNVIQSHLRKRSRRWRWFGPSLDAREAGTQPTPGLSVPATIEEDAARRQMIDRALAALPVDLRIAVTLRDVHGFDYAEIASMLGVPIGTVESRIFRARQRLRPLLAPLLSRGQNVQAPAGDRRAARAGGPVRPPDAGGFPTPDTSAVKP